MVGQTEVKIQKWSNALYGNNKSTMQSIKSKTEVDFPKLCFSIVDTFRFILIFNYFKYE